MARTEIPLIVLDPATGNAVVGASVAVKDRVTGSASTVYAAETGATTVTNPRTTDAYGRVSGWIERGSYQFDISGTGLVSYTEYYESSPGGDGTIDTNWIASSAVTNIKIADGTLTPAKGAQGTFPTYVTSLPSSPVDGQEVYYAADATNGVIWHLRYRAASSSSYKWEFIGGPPLTDYIATDQSTTSGTFTDLATAGPTITLALAGDYVIQLEVMITPHANQWTYAQAIVFDDGSAMSGPQVNGFANFYDASTTRRNALISTSASMRQTGIGAGSVMKVKYSSSNGADASSFSRRALTITPVRVG